MKIGLAASAAIAAMNLAGTCVAQELKILSPHQHGPASLRHLHEDGTADSTNWSGYAVTGTNGSVTSVSGSWTVPTVNCTGVTKSEYASFWVGIDGWSSSTVEQIGTDSDCSGGKPSYYAWYEFYPQPSYNIAKMTNLTPGHVILATVTYSNGEFTATITDESDPSLTFTTTYANTSKHGAPKRSSAEWIAEAPAGGQILPLADFGTVSWGQDYTMLLSPATCYATINGVTGPIGAFGSNVWSTTMVAEKTGAPKATPSSLTPDGSSFYITWNSVGP